MNRHRVTLKLEEVECRQTPSTTTVAPLFEAGLEAPNPVATHKALSLSLNQLSTNGIIDADYTIGVRVVLNTEVVKLFTIDLTAGQTLAQAQQAAIIQINAQQGGVGTGWENDGGQVGVNISFIDQQNQYIDVESGSASIIKLNGENVNPPSPLVTEVVDTLG